MQLSRTNSQGGLTSKKGRTGNVSGSRHNSHAPAIFLSIDALQ
jgi:hypothetical protein